LQLLVLSFSSLYPDIKGDFILDKSEFAKDCPNDWNFIIFSLMKLNNAFFPTPYSKKLFQ